VNTDIAGFTEGLNKGGARYLKNKSAEVIAKSCFKCSEMKALDDYATKILGFANRRSICRSCSRFSRIASRLKNRDKSRGIISSISEEEVLSVLLRHGNRCVLTGSKDFHIDHVIPVSLGLVGAEKENIIPLRADLNESKGNRNIFDWFRDNRDLLELEQRKFDELIEYLADLNDMSTKDYEDYVQRCHDNPRTVDELESTAI